MEILHSTFLPKQSFPSFKIHQNTNPKPNITSNSSFNTLQPTKTLKTSKNSISQKRKNQSLLATIFNKVDDLICNFLDSPLRPSIDPNHVLSGGLAPVNELSPTACVVSEGSLPPCLDGGTYIRNGPNPQFIPNRRPYHFLDGDGMLHAIKISNGEATFCCRYVSTHKHAAERDAGYPFVPSVFSSFNGAAASAARAALLAARVLIGQLDPVNRGFGAANTSLALISGRLFALCESDLPYAINLTAEGDVETLGRHDFGAVDPITAMMAHPKIDRITGEAFAFAYSIKPPFLTFFRIDSGGRKQENVPIMSMDSFTCAHDFAVTANYAVFFDIQITVNPWWILLGRSPAGIDAAKVPRLGILPRYAVDERDMRWIEAPGLNILHCVNAWEEEEEEGGAVITLVASNAAAVEHVLERVDLAELTMEKITVNLEAATVERRQLSMKPLDLPVINPAYAAKENR